MKKHRNNKYEKNSKLSRTNNNQRAYNDYNEKTGEHTPRLIGHTESTKLKGKNTEQNKLINEIFSGGDIIVTGPAGTGKTFVSSVCSLDMILNDKYKFKKLVLIRPNEPLGPSVGMLKGDMIEKIWPWISPFIDGFDHRINRKQLTDMIQVGQIELVLVEHLRGRTFKDSIILVDEIQNMGYKAGECLMGRKGEGSKMIIMGDLDQCDLRDGQPSALEYIDRVDDLAIHIGVNRPYNYIQLRINERSAESSWWCTMTNELDIIDNGE